MYYIVIVLQDLEQKCYCITKSLESDKEIDSADENQQESRITKRRKTVDDMETDITDGWAKLGKAMMTEFLILFAPLWTFV